MGNSTQKQDELIQLTDVEVDEDLHHDCKCCNRTNFNEGECLHQAVKKKDAELVEQLILENSRCLLAMNCDGEIPLHLACKHNSKNMIKLLLQSNAKKQLETKNKIFENTPLHVAACLGNEEAVIEILKTYADSAQILSFQNKLNDTPVHSAANKGFLSILKKMHDKAENCTKYEGRFNGLPLHSACGYGHYDTVKKLLKWDKSTLELPSTPVDLPAFTHTTEPIKELDENEKKDYRKRLDHLKAEEGKLEKHDDYTPLTRACQFGHSEIVKFLLDEGAELNPFALIKAIEGLYSNCVELLLFQTDEKKGRIFRNGYRELLHFYYTSDNDPLTLTTPFRELIKHMPGVAKQVLQNCVEYERFLVNSKNFKIKLNYEFIDDDRNVITAKQVEYTRFHSTSSQQPEETDHPTPVTAPGRCSKIGFNKETHPLSLMVKYKREELLTHPVVAGLIYKKWKLYGPLSLFHWAAYSFVFLLIINILFVLLPNPSSDHCLSDKELEISSGLGLCLSNTSNSINCTSTLWNPEISTMIGLVTVILAYSIIRLIFEVIQLFLSVQLAFRSLHCNKDLWFNLFGAIKRVNYIWDLINWIEVPLFVLSIIFTMAVYNGNYCLSVREWQIGVLVLFFAWIEFILLSTQFDFIGLHALMLIRVMKTLFKFVPLVFLLIVTFGLTFYFLLYQPELQGSPYSSPGYSFLKVLSMTAGDLNADNFFGLSIDSEIQNKNHLSYVPLTTFIWLLSLIIMTIILSNLLIGLAVGDIQSIHDEALFEKLALQVNYLLTAESQSQFCCCKQQKDKAKDHFVFSFEPNKRSKRDIILRELIHFIWGGVRYDSQESIEKLIQLKN